MSALLVQARGQACALPLADVIETMRPLPVAPLADLPPFVPGVAVVRGQPTPVIDLGLLLGSKLDGPVTRFVTVHAGSRRAVLAVAEVRGIRSLTIERVLPASGMRGGLVESMATLEGALLLVVRPARLLSDDLWRSLEVCGS